MGTVNDKIKNVIRNWLEIQPSVGDTITIQETNTFEGNCFRNLLWYRGDASELHQYYTQTDDLMGNAKFWAAQSTNGINFRKIHTGLPAMIVDMLADIIVDSFNKIEVKNNNEAQKNWEEIAKENDFKETLKQAIIDVFVQCDGAFKISYDTDISKYPIIEFYSGQDVDYEYTRGRITGINFKNKYPKTYNTLYSQDIIIEKQDSILEKIFVVENSIKIEKDKLSSIEDSVMTDSILKLLYEFWIVNSYDPSKVDKTKLFITNKTFTSYKNNIPEIKKEVVPPKEEYKEIKIDNLKLPGLDEEKPIDIDGKDYLK